MSTFVVNHETLNNIFSVLDNINRSANNKNRATLVKIKF